MRPLLRESAAPVFRLACFPVGLFSGWPVFRLACFPVGLFSGWPVQQLQKMSGRRNREFFLPDSVICSLDQFGLCSITLGLEFLVLHWNSRET